MPRCTTETDKYRRGWAARFIEAALAAGKFSLRSVDKALAERGAAGDRRSALREALDQTRTLSASSAARLGAALNGLGLGWASAGLALYGCGYFGEWVRFLACLRRESYPAAIVATFATAALGNPMHRLLWEPNELLPQETNEMLVTLGRDVPRSHLSRLQPDVLSAAEKRWFRGQCSTGSNVRMALQLDRGHDTPYLPEGLCLSLAINDASSLRADGDLEARPLFEMMYEAYYRRLPAFVPFGQPQPSEVRTWAGLRVGQLEEALGCYF